MPCWISDEMIWKCRDKKIEYGKKILIMGIVNVTPDSFSDGGRYFSAEKAVERALELERDGADIIDIGAQSTRPGCSEISDKEEWNRLRDAVNTLRGKTALPISVDTYYPYVAEKALAAGADIINDVSGRIQEETAELIKNSGAGWVITHNGPGGVRAVKAFFEHAAAACERLGIDPARICLDMGIGFGKSYEENLELLARVGSYKISGYPLLLGTSRKSVIGQSSGQTDPKKRIYGNIAADTAAILGGADIIRVHDVKNEKQGILTAQSLREYSG